MDESKIVSEKQMIDTLEALVKKLPGYPNPDDPAERSFAAGAWNICAEEILLYHRQNPTFFQRSK